jgi:HEAT repeat protein
MTALNAWGPYFQSICVVLFLVWIAISLALILNRALYDVRARKVRFAQRQLEEARHQTAPFKGDEETVRALLARLPRKVIEAVAAHSGTPSWQAELFARYAIERWGSTELIEAASQRKRHRKWMRIEALRILVLGNHPNAMRLLEQASTDHDRDVAGAAVVLLGHRADEPAARLLVHALQRGFYSRSRIATQIDRLSVSVSHLLLPLLRDPLPDVRFWAATLLEKYAGSARINHELASAAHDENPNVRKAAVETLGKAGGPYATEAALDRLDDPVWYVRAHAARALGDVRRTDLCARVAPLLADREWWVRTAAKETLQAMGAEAVPAIIPYLDSPDKFARNGAAEVLQNLGVVDEILARAIRPEQPVADLGLIRSIMTAGGNGFVQAAVGRSQPDVRPDLVRVLEQAGIRAA